jgi:hypothetical protein
MRKKNFIFPSENRLCVYFPTLIPSIATQDIDAYLNIKDIKKLNIDIIELTREQIGKPYYRGTTYKNNQSFDCSSFTQWLYGQKGIYISRISIDQRYFGKNVNLTKIKTGDLIFTTGYKNYYYERNPDGGIGHVGIYTGRNSIIHAANKERGVVEDSLLNFCKNKFRGAVRIHNNLAESTTLILPQKSDIEYDQHLCWRILQYVK